MPPLPTNRRRAASVASPSSSQPTKTTEKNTARHRDAKRRSKARNRTKPATPPPSPPSSRHNRHSSHQPKRARIAQRTQLTPFNSAAARPPTTPPPRPRLTCHNAQTIEGETAREDDDADTCLTTPGGKCYALVQDFVDPASGRLERERLYGCLPADDDGFLFQCGFASEDGSAGSLRARAAPQNGKTVVCCSTGDLCNRHLHPVYAQRSDLLLPPPVGMFDLVFGRYADVSPTGGVAIALAALLVASLVAIVSACVWSCLWYRRRRRRRRRHNSTSKDIEGGSNSSNSSSLKSSTETVSDTATVCAPTAPGMLVQRTIAKEITLERPLGHGRFGDVWLGQFNDERVAVKVFLPAAAEVGLHEAHTYRSVMMRHENIQRFVGSDVDAAGRRVLVTHYHELGSVHSYLAHGRRGRPLSGEQLVRMAYSLAAGLGHLHTEICGLSGKQAIAHGALSARNVLVRRDLQCVIADFALAVQYESGSEVVRPPARTVAEPDWRYVAPEVLAAAAGGTGSMVAETFKAYQMADMYAAGLLWWQMARCCAEKTKAEVRSGGRAADGGEDGGATNNVAESNGEECEGYAMPYEEELQLIGAARVFGAVPRREDMRRVVCASAERPVGCRPAVPERWERSGEEIVRALRAIILDCWNENGAARLTSLRVKKTLGKLRENPVEFG